MDEELVDRIEAVVESYLDDIDDPGDVDARVLAENIALSLAKGKK